jgi:SAM-dependent methyltransferase
MTPSLPPDYFDNLYADSADPWKISTGWYEQRKRALVLAALPQQRYSLGFEPGCSNGELTVGLAERCDRLLAWDVADVALDQARARTAQLSGVQIRQAALPAEWPTEQAELIVLSEVGYYLDANDLERAIELAVEHLITGGTLLAVHWRHPAPDYPTTGDQVHRRIDAHDGLQRLAGYQDTDFLLDVWTKGPTPSVAQTAGLV